MLPPFEAASVVVLTCVVCVYRDRDAPVGRFNKKRPSMLSEFQSHGKYYNHRDADRER